MATAIFGLLQAFKIPIYRDWHGKHDSISTPSGSSRGPIPFYSEEFICGSDSFSRSDYLDAKHEIDNKLGANGIYVENGDFVQTVSGSATAYVCNYVSTWAPTFPILFDSRGYDKFSDKLDALCGPQVGGREKWQFMWASTSYGRGSAANGICIDGKM
jgi:hypothetical protein